MEIKTKFDYGSKVTFLTTDTKVLDPNSDKIDRGLFYGEFIISEGEVRDVEPPTDDIVHSGHGQSVAGLIRIGVYTKPH